MKELLIEYLKNNCVGYDNRQKSNKLMKIVSIADNKEFRTLIEEIRQSKETIFSDDNHDVETLCRWAKHYGFVDLVKENEKDKLGYYKLQDDYTKQSFYVWLDKEERKQYDYEDFLLDKIEEKGKEIERLNNIIYELEKWLEDQWLEWKDCETDVRFMANEDKAILDKLKELKEGK